MCGTYLYIKHFGESFEKLNLEDLRIRIRICLFSYTHKIQYEKYKWKCYIMKNISIMVSHINVVVNQTDSYKI